MTLLHAECPQRLPPLLALKTPFRSIPEIIQCKTLQACITFLPTTSQTWLVTSGATSLAAVPFTLLCDVEPRSSTGQQQRQTTLV